MQWCLIKQRGFHQVEQTVYDLSHLQDVQHCFNIEATDRYAAVEGRLLVQYSSHCISFGAKQGQVLNFDELGAERLVVDDKGDARCFCDKRYAWSKYLPSVFANFLDRRCFFTSHDNWLTIELLDAYGNQIEYEIFLA